MPARRMVTVTENTTSIPRCDECGAPVIPNVGAPDAETTLCFECAETTLSEAATD